MTTKARLGIDIVAANMTAAAFAGVQRSMDTIKRSVEATKFLMAGFVGGQFLDAMMTSFVNVAKQEPRVKGALDNLAQAWNGFARKVGEAGLNDALVNFASRIGGLITGTDGLSRSIGAFTGGAVNMMAGLFEGVGRAIAFAYDNAALFGRLIGGMAIITFAQQIIRTAAGFYFLAKSIRQTGIIMSAFHAISKANLLVFLALAAGIAYATDSVDALRGGIDMMWKKVKEVFPMIADTTTSALEGMGFNMDALSSDISNASKWIDGLGAVKMPVLAKATHSASQETAKLGTTYKSATNSIADTAATMDQAQGAASRLAETVGQDFRRAFDSIIAGTMNAKEAFRSMIGDMLSSVADALMSSALQQFVKLLTGGGPASAAGGLVASLIQGFAGARAGGGPVQAGKSYLVGERGPEIVRFGAGGTVIPNDMISRSANTNAAAPSVSYSPSIVINGNADEAVIQRALAAERSRMKQELPRMIRDERKRGRI